MMRQDTLEISVVCHQALMAFRITAYTFMVCSMAGLGWLSIKDLLGLSFPAVIPLVMDKKIFPVATIGVA